MTDRLMPDRTRPHGDLTVHTLAMPDDANAAGDIFGGCGMRAAERGAASSRRR